MKPYIHQCLAISLAALAWSAQPAQAASDGSSTLSGDWGGLRRHWADQGVNFEAVYTAAVISTRRLTAADSALVLGARLEIFL